MCSVLFLGLASYLNQLSVSWLFVRIHLNKPRVAISDDTVIQSQNENQQHLITVQDFALAYGAVTAQHKTINKTADRLELPAKWRADICKTYL